MDESDFNPAGPWGLAHANPADFPAEPANVRPDYMTNGELASKGYHVEQIGSADGFYWVTQGIYDAAFLTTGQGVIAIDAPPQLGELMLAAIEEVTDEPVTHVVYSHWHSDHIGAAAMYGPSVKIYAHEITRELLERWPDPLRPLPTETFSKDATLEVGGTRLELSYRGENHCPGNIFMYAPAQRALTAIDIVSPGWSVFMHCDGSENITGWMEAHDQLLDYDFDVLVGGHVSRYGTRSDVVDHREYINDILAYSYEVLRETTMTRGGRTSSAATKEILAEALPLRAWTAVENLYSYRVNHVTHRTLTKVTSNGQTWAERLAGASNMTKYHAWSILETSIRLHRSHEGYERRDPSQSNYLE